MKRLGQVVDDISTFMSPTPLAFAIWKYLRNRSPASHHIRIFKSNSQALWLLFYGSNNKSRAPLCCGHRKVNRVTHIFDRRGQSDLSYG